MTNNWLDSHYKTIHKRDSQRMTNNQRIVSERLTARSRIVRESIYLLLLGQSRMIWHPTKCLIGEQLMKLDLSIAQADQQI